MKSVKKMEQDVDDGYRPLCCACLSSDRNLVALNGLPQVVEVFKLLMFNFVGDQIVDTEMVLKQLVCWECLAIMKKMAKFKKQVQNAQKHLQNVILGRPLEAMDHTYSSQSLSSLECVINDDYDRMYTDYTPDVAIASEDWPRPIKRENIMLGIDDQVLRMPESVVENPVTGVMSHIVVGDPLLDKILATPGKAELPELILDSTISVGSVIIKQQMKAKTQVKDEEELKRSYDTEYMCEADMLALREDDKKKVQYANAAYKCEVCIIGFYNQQQVEDHFLAAHRPRPGFEACKVCYVYLESSKLSAHQASHYLMYVCRLCDRSERTSKAIAQHVAAHLSRQQPSALIKMSDAETPQKESDKSPPTPDDSMKMLSKTTTEANKCLNCDMFLKNSRARRSHVGQCYMAGLQCDHCKKIFVNKAALASHLRTMHSAVTCKECGKNFPCYRNWKVHHRLHHQQTPSYCVECDLRFTNRHRYMRHLKYSAKHTTRPKLSIPCPDCDQVFTKNCYMEEHHAYVHLQQFNNRCEVCDKSFLRKPYLLRHIRHVHDRIQPIKDKICYICGKRFSNNTILTNHLYTHTGERPHACELCSARFRQSAALATHRRALHPEAGPMPRQELHKHRPFECELCSVKYTTAERLEKHKRDIHLVSKVSSLK